MAFSHPTTPEPVGVSTIVMLQFWPIGVPMPLKEDPAYQEWSWFPHGSGRDFKPTRCRDPLEDLRDDLTILSGLSHPAVRNVHGHRNADQFLTGADTGNGGEYNNSAPWIS